jgi:hypothetical protein
VPLLTTRYDCTPSGVLWSTQPSTTTSQFTALADSGRRVSGRVGRVGHFGAELLGPGDIMRPWQHDGEDVTLPFGTRFHVIEQSVLALLDLRFAARAAPYPEVTGALVGRAMQRSRTLA